MNDLALQQRAPRGGVASQLDRAILYVLGESGRETVGYRAIERVALALRNGALVCFTQLGRRLQQRVEHHAQIERRTTNDFEHVGGGGLLLQGFAQVVEQARVLDGYDRLIGKSRYQCNLLFGKRLHCRAQQPDHADCQSVVEERNAEHGAMSTEPCGFALLVVGISQTIFDMDRAAREGSPPDETAPINTNRIS